VSEDNKKIVGPGGIEIPPDCAIPIGTADGGQVCIANRDDNLSVGLLKHTEDGESMPDDACFITRMEGTPFYKIGESIAELKSGAKGPAKVNSKSYRDGYDRIFGKQTVGQA
jgi:hypothetical protein